MSKHHEMALQMASSAKFETAEVRQLAEKMTASQRQELSELKKHLVAHSSE